MGPSLVPGPLPSFSSLATSNCPAPPHTAHTSEISSEEAARTRKLPGGKVPNVIMGPQVDLQPKGSQAFPETGLPAASYYMTPQSPSPALSTLAKKASILQLCLPSEHAICVVYSLKVSKCLESPDPAPLTGLSASDPWSLATLNYAACARAVCTSPAGFGQPGPSRLVELRPHLNHLLSLCVDRKRLRLTCKWATVTLSDWSRLFQVSNSSRVAHNMMPLLRLCPSSCSPARDHFPLPDPASSGPRLGPRTRSTHPVSPGSVWPRGWSWAWL